MSVRLAPSVSASFTVFVLALGFATAAPPQPGDPLIKGISPEEGPVGEHVLITGVNFGNAPEVRIGGVVAPIEAYRPDLGRLVASVPAGVSGSDLTVRNTNTGETSNAATFTALSGSYTPICTISGTVTGPSALPVFDAIVVAYNEDAAAFSRLETTSAQGSYSLGLDAEGDYHLSFVAPNGTTYHDADYQVTCTGVQDHQFANGHLLSGRVLDAGASPLASAHVVAEDEDGFTAEVISEPSGGFSMRVRSGTFDVLVEGPVGGRHVSELREAVLVDSDTDLGDVELASGVLVSGTVLYRDDAARGPAMNALVLEFDEEGELVGSSTSIADGSFYLPSPDGGTVTLSIIGDTLDLNDLTVFSVTVDGDVSLDYALLLHSSAGQLPATPILINTDSRSIQVDQPIPFDAVGLRGDHPEVYFSDGSGGWVEGVNTIVEPDWGIVATTVPATAVTGEAYLQVDGVRSPGYPLTIDSTPFDPGPWTMTGVIDDGTGPVENVIVAMVSANCNAELLVDYDLTAADGRYSVAHGDGPHELIFFPPIDSGMVAGYRGLPDLSGDGTLDLTLEPGFLVTARCVDSGIGPVGGGDAVGGCYLSTEGVDMDFDSLADADGVARLRVSAGVYEFVPEPAFQSRFLPAYPFTREITEDTDLGDIELDSGNLVQGRVVDPGGHGIAGVEIDAWFVYDGHGTTVGEDGEFLVTVPNGVFDLYFEVPPDHPYYVPPVFGIEVYDDYAVHPATTGLDVGAIEGTVTDSEGVPVGNVTMRAWHDVYGSVDDAESCEDGSYSLRAPTGDFQVQAEPDLEGRCYADEWYDNHYPGCGADLVSVTSPIATGGIDFTLEQAGFVTGVVTDDWGLGVEGVTVCAIAQPSMGICAEVCRLSEWDGSYELLRLPLGDDYSIQAFGAGYPTECWDDHVNCLSYDPVSVAHCVETSNIDFLMSGAPGPVPDGWNAPGTMMTAGYDKLTGMLLIHWQPTCSADNHAAYFGPLGDFSSYSSAECVMGVTGDQPVPAPPGNVFFVVAGASGNRVGSLGVDSEVLERPAPDGSLCGYVQDLTAGCVP